MNKSRLPTAIMAAALVGGGGLRLAGALAQHSIGLDDGISYLAATGHEGEYDRTVREGRFPVGTWAKASDWKRFIRPDKAFCFGLIRSDLARYDVHPPLYFWLLHSWSLPFGLSPLSASLLNLLLFFPAALALFSFARLCLKNDPEAALVVFAWSFSPAVIPVSFAARMYGLLTIFTIVFARLIARCSEPGEKIAFPRAASLTAVTAAGLLTHYHFALLLLGGVVFSAIRLGRLRIKRWCAIAACCLAGIAVFIVLHPDFYSSFLFQRFQAETTRGKGALPREGRVLSAFLEFFVGNRSAQKAVLAGGILLLAAAAVSAWKRKNHGFRGFNGLNKKRNPINPRNQWFLFLNTSARSADLFFFFWLSAWVVLLYLSRLSSYQQIGSRYLAMVYPFFAFLPFRLFRCFPSAKGPLAALFCAAMLCSGVLMVVRFGEREAKSAALSRRVERAESVIIGNLTRLFLPGVVWQIPDRTPVLAAGHEVLLERVGEWTPRLGAESYYFDRPILPEEKRRRPEVMAKLLEGHRVEPVPGGAFGAGEAFEIEENIY